MNRLLLLFSFVLFALSGQSQITVGSETFPQLGDTLYTKTDNLPSNINLLTPGEDLSWNFSSLQSPFTSEIVMESPQQGQGSSFFPDADMMINLGNLGESYYRVDDSHYELLGSYGSDPSGFGLELATIFSEPLIERSAPLNYLDQHLHQTNLNLPFSWDDIPSSITDSLNLPFTPDSLKLILDIQRTDEVDAWGTLTIPGGIYDILREKRIRISEIELWAKIPVFNWQNVTETILGLTGFEELKPDTTVTYNFFSNDAKEPIAVVTVQGEEEAVSNVEYKSNDLTSHVQSAHRLKPTIYAYPNPAIVNVRFEFSNLAPGNYDLVIYNILGREVWKKKYFINGNKTEKVNISRLKKGTYLYSLKSHDGRTITTRRLIVVRP